MEPRTDREQLVTTRAAAEMLGLSEHTLERWRHEESRGLPVSGPPFVRIGGRTIRYRVADLEAYIHAARAEAEA